MERLTTDKEKIFIREAATLMGVSKDELRRHYNDLFDRLAAYEDTALEPEDIPLVAEMQRQLEEYQKAIERQGDFGRLFLEYTGCPRGAYGRMGQPGGASIPNYELLAKEVLAQPPIKDVDGGEWIPVHAEALREMVREYKAQTAENATPRAQLAAAVALISQVNNVAIGTVEHLTELVKAEQKRREGCGWCHDQQNLMYYKFNEYVICPHCGRDLRGESHDGD